MAIHFRTRIRFPDHSNQKPSGYFLFISRFISKSLSESTYDPPFSPVSKLQKTKKKKKKAHGGNSNLNENPTLPLKSYLPFDFFYSYSETNPLVNPIGYRESPKFSPFGPGRLDRKWTGTSAPSEVEVNINEVLEERKRILGDPLLDEEVAELVEQYRHNDCSRQINLGKGGVTHNMLDDIHNHWKRADAVRIKCLGVPTLDMDNICFHLEDKSGGKIIYRHINILLLYRGRNYDPKNRPAIPLMLWKPYAPIYPKLVKNVADGLSFDETKEMRSRGLNSPPLMKLTRNGVYVTVVDRVREAFEFEEVVRLDCTHVGGSDCKQIGFGTLCAHIIQGRADYSVEREKRSWRGHELIDGGCRPLGCACGTHHPYRVLILFMDGPHYAMDCEGSTNTKGKGNVDCNGAPYLE